MANYITNADGKDLRQRLVELIQKSDSLRFLVGFSIFQE